MTVTAPPIEAAAMRAPSGERARAMTGVAPAPTVAARRAVRREKSATSPSRAGGDDLAVGRDRDAR